MRTLRFRIILILALILSLFGLISIYSAGGGVYFRKQLLWFLISLGGFWLAYRTEKRLFLTLSPIFYIIGLLLLIFTLSLNRGDVKRWLSFGSVSIQPAEFAKVTTILFLAWTLAGKKKFFFSFSSLFLPILLVLLPSFLIFIQPDLGSSLSLLAILALILYFKGLKGYEIVLLFSPLFSCLLGLSFTGWVIYFFALALFLYFRSSIVQFLSGLGVNSLFGLLTPVILNSLKDYQRARLLSFLSSSLDYKGAGWSSFQSKVAIGSGLLLGKGYLRGKMARLEFIPNRHTDFIFATIGEEFGFIGGAILILLFLYFIYHLLSSLRGLRDEAGQLVIAGGTGLFLYHIATNLGMVLGILPVTGITLPFISYGGSSLLANFLLLGIMLNFATKD